MSSTTLHTIIKRQKVRGFTMLELLIVVVIIGLLAALVGPRFFGQLSKSKQQAARAQVTAVCHPGPRR